MEAKIILGLLFFVQCLLSSVVLTLDLLTYPEICTSRN